MTLPGPHPMPLYVRLHNWIGDVVVGLPALRLLADAGVALECVGKGWAPALLEGHGWPVHQLPAGLRARAAQWRGLRARQQRGSGGPGVDALLLATSFSAAPRHSGNSSVAESLLIRSPREASADSGVRRCENDR